MISLHALQVLGEGHARWCVQEIECIHMQVGCLLPRALPTAMCRAMLTPPLVLQVKAPRHCLRGTNSTTTNGTQ